MSKNILMITPNTVKEKTTLHDNTADELVIPEIKTCQDMYIMPVLGTALYNKIQSDILANSLSGIYLTIVDDYIADCLCYYVLAELAITLNYQFWNKGVSQKTTDNSTVPSMSEAYNILDKYKSKAEFYRRRCIQFLKQNVVQIPEYARPGIGIDVVTPENNAYQCPIALPDYKLKIPPNVPQVFNSNDPSYR